MKRQYSLFAKIDGKHKRVAETAYTLSNARRLFQNRLLSGSLSGIEMNLKPIKDGKPEYDPIANKQYWQLMGFVD